MKNLKEYIVGARKEHKFKIRILGDWNDSDVIARIERHLKKYNLVEISKPKVTAIQKSPLGFDGPVNSEVTIIDIVLDFPVTSTTLAMEIALLLGVSVARVRVKADYEGCDDEEETKELNEPYVTKVSTDPAYPEDKGQPAPEESYGDKYNEKMISTLSAARKEAKDQILKGTK